MCRHRYICFLSHSAGSKLAEYLFSVPLREEDYLELVVTQWSPDVDQPTSKRCGHQTAASEPQRSLGATNHRTWSTSFRSACLTQHGPKGLFFKDFFGFGMQFKAEKTMEVRKTSQGVGSILEPSLAKAMKGPTKPNSQTAGGSTKKPKNQRFTALGTLAAQDSKP